jgi:hypothetical protein
VPPPPQGYVVAGGLAWNYTRSRHGRETISQFLRRHKTATALGLAVFVVWFPPHIFLKES